MLLVGHDILLGSVQVEISIQYSVKFIMAVCDTWMIEQSSDLINIYGYLKIANDRVNGKKDVV